MNCVNNCENRNRAGCGCGNEARVGCGCNANRAGCGCENETRVGCGCNANRAGCGCGNETRVGCGCNANRAGCGCGNETRVGCGCNANRAGCGCENETRVGCGCNANRAGCGCGNETRVGCGCNANRAGCGCGNETRVGCGCGCGCGCQGCCNHLKIKGASFLAPELITVIAGHPVPLIDEFNFSDGDIFHEVDNHIVLLNEGIYEINYSFNALSNFDTLLRFGLLLNGLPDVSTEVVETVYANEWNALSKTFFISVFSSSEIALTNLSTVGIEIGNLNLTIKKVSNVSVL